MRCFPHGMRSNVITDTLEKHHKMLFGEVEINDLRINARPYARLTPGQALDLAEHLARVAFQKMLTEELDRNMDRNKEGADDVI